MTITEAIILGVIQGVFMFFPVSSTSHLVLMQHFMIAQGSELPSPESAQMVLFDLLVHVGTLVSIAVVFAASLTRFLFKLRDDMLDWLSGARARTQPGLHLRLFMLGMFSVFVTGVLGLAFKDTIQLAFGHPVVVAVMLGLTGVMLYFTDSLRRRPRGLRQLTIMVAVVIGIAQFLALTPGLSRSGMTIAFALFVGLKRRWAAEYSFFIAIPTILAATGVEAISFYRDGGLVEVPVVPYLVGIVVAALVGIVALKLVVVLLYRARFRYFSYYVWMLAIAVLIAAMTGTLTPDDFH